MSGGRTKPASNAPRRTQGFGFEPVASPYHFTLRVGLRARITILERFAAPTGADGAAEPAGDEDGREVEKARLDAYRWERVADIAAQEFNGRLIAEGVRSGRWLKTETPLAPHFGKELALLAWAIEDADPTLIPIMVANWRGLAPEERWWFYTTINATLSHVDHGKDRGWRKAIKIAFAGNPVQLPPSALLVGPQQIDARDATKGKRAAPRRATPSTDAGQGRLRLFDLDAPADAPKETDR
ncbi:MAG: DUF3780 domain-containing protein [Chloroflexia bacterium]|nr:DUF3780 domain-containing protein [Chloroflexia bacterium]